MPPDSYEVLHLTPFINFLSLKANSIINPIIAFPFHLLSIQFSMLAIGFGGYLYSFSFLDGFVFSHSSATFAFAESEAFFVSVHA